MGCCGGTIEQVTHIAVGYTRLATDTIGLTTKYAFTDSRIRECQQCDESTWLTIREYYQWLKDNGIEILENFTQLGTRPKLPRYEQDNKRRNIFCRICKCYIPAKARVFDCQCPKGKW